MSANESLRQEGTDTQLTAFDGRPDDCACFAGTELPCFACYLEGFEDVNPSAGGE